MAHPAKQVRAAHLSSWMEESGCGVLFSRDEDTDDEYLLIQRHFEEPDDGRPYIESPSSLLVTDTTHNKINSNTRACRNPSANVN